MSGITEDERRRAIIEIVVSADGEDVGADGIADALLDEVDRWLPELREARAAAGAPLEKALRERMPGVVLEVLNANGWGVYDTRVGAVWVDRHLVARALSDALLSAPSPVREPEGLDVAWKPLALRYRGRLRGIAEDRTITTLENARAVARAALATTPERPADEVDSK